MKIVYMMLASAWGAVIGALIAAVFCTIFLPLYFVFSVVLLGGSLGGLIALTASIIVLYGKRGSE